MINPKLQEIVESIQNPQLQAKVVAFLENPTFSLEGKVYSGPSFDVSPGGLAHHHSYEGGYIEHVAATAKLAFALCDVVEDVYGGKVNRDIVMAGVLLHDVFKPVTYALDERGEYVSSPIADCLDHISLATVELVRREFPAELIHVVAAHYGDHGTTRPRTLEALVLHLADNTDSQLNGQVLDAAWYLTRKATGEPLEKPTFKEAHEVVTAKATDGLKGVKKAVEKILQDRKAQKT